VKRAKYEQSGGPGDPSASGIRRIIVRASIVGMPQRQALPDAGGKDGQLFMRAWQRFGGIELGALALLRFKVPIAQLDFVED